MSRTLENKLAFINERIRRGTYSPRDLEVALLGLPIDRNIKERLMKAAAERKPERPVYPFFTEPTPRSVKEKYAKIALTLTPEYDADGNPWHTYWGGWHDNRLFVKSFSGKDIEFTKEEKEAYKFTDDHMCDACMAKLIMEHNAWTISLWKDDSQMVHYPGEHWRKNDYLIPSFINRNGVDDFYKEGIVFDRRQGWHKKET